MSSTTFTDNNTVIYASWLNDVNTAVYTTLPSLGKRVTVLTDGYSIAPNADTTDMAIQTNTQTLGTLSIAAPSGTPVDSQKIMIRITSTNAHTLSWSSSIAGSVDTPLPGSLTGASKTDYIGLIYSAAANKWHLLGKQFGF